MSKKKLNEIGYSTSLIHDTKNSTFIEQGIYPLISKLHCYYTDTAIIGIFPLYKDSTLNKSLGYYNTFIKEWPQIEATLKSKGINVKQETVYFDKGEYITYIKGYYDEHSQKILGVKYSTSKRKANSFGNHTIINTSKNTVNLAKHGYFITGFRTDYIKDNMKIPHLSYIRVYYDKDENIEKYIPTYASSGNVSANTCIKKVMNFFTSIFAFPFTTVYTVYTYLSMLFTLCVKISIILALLSYPFVLYYQTSQNIQNGVIKVSSRNSAYTLTNNNNVIEVYVDEHGLSHIKADDVVDAYFALGYEHAKNRLWAMDVARRISRGKLSELLGERTLDIDVAMRSFGLNELAMKGGVFVKENSAYIKEIQAYVNGVNFYAKNFVLPIEYVGSGNTFEEWNVEDSVAIFYLYSVVLSHDWNMEVWYKKMEEHLGKEFAETVLSYREHGYPFWNETIVSDEELMEMGLHRFRKIGEEEVNEERDLVGKLKKQKLQQQQQNEQHNDDAHYEQQQPLTSDGASNCWTISGKHTQSGKPILSNDPHLPNSMPSLFFLAKLYLPHNVITGASLPGTPVFPTGSNNKISWGVTTENSDNTDICEEIIDNNSYFTHDNTFIPLRTTTETINVKSSLPHTITVQWTQHGPIISQTIPRSFLMLNEPFHSQSKLSFRNPMYTSNFTSIDFYFKLNHARSSADFLPYTQLHSTPNYNLHWSTTTNEIGWTPIGRFPVKPYHNGFCKGYSNNYNKGDKQYIPLADIPKLINPSKGFIISANNKFASFNYTYQLHGHHNHVRAYRLRQLITSHINNNHRITINDTVEMLNDVHDSLAEATLPKLLHILERNMKQSINNDVYYNMLKTWDYNFNSNSTAATLYSVLEKEIGVNLVMKKLNEHSAKGIINYLHYWNFISGMIDKIYNGERINMKECIHQSGNTNCEKYLVSIYSQLHYFLVKGNYLNKDNTVKQWGDVAVQYYPHTPFDNVPLLKKLYSRKQFTKGNRNCVNIARNTFNHAQGEFVSTHSANLRFVCDMSQPTTPYVSLPAGNAGSPLQRYYDVFMNAHGRGEVVAFANVDFSGITNDKKVIIMNDDTN